MFASVTHKQTSFNHVIILSHCLTDEETFTLYVIQHKFHFSNTLAASMFSNQRCLTPYVQSVHLRSSVAKKTFVCLFVDIFH